MKEKEDTEERRGVRVEGAREKEDEGEALWKGEGGSQEGRE